MYVRPFLNTLIRPQHRTAQGMRILNGVLCASQAKEASVPDLFETDGDHFLFLRAAHSQCRMPLE